MPTIFCAAQGCGAMIDYTGSKPKTCSKCNQSFSSVFANITAPVATPTKQQLVAPKPRSTKLLPKSRPSRFDSLPSVASSIMNPPEDLEAIPPGSEDLEEDGGPVSQDQVAAYAEELRASINEDDIRVDLGDGPIRYRDWVAKPNQ